MAKTKTVDLLSANEERMENFFNSVTSQVSEKMEKIISEGEEEKQRILAEANNQSLQLAYDDIQDSARKSASKYTLVANKSELDIKKSILKYRSDLVDKMFGNVADKLIAFRKTDAYLDYLKKSFLSENVSKEAIVYLRADDLHFSDEIQKLAKSKLSFKTDSFIKLGGLSIYYPDDSVIIDKTMDSALADEKKAFTAGGKFTVSEQA